MPYGVVENPYRASNDGVTRRRFKTVSPWLLVIIALPWVLIAAGVIVWWVSRR